jgi:hypothetical protein
MKPLKEFFDLQIFANTGAIFIATFVVVPTKLTLFGLERLDLQSDPVILIIFFSLIVFGLLINYTNIIILSIMVCSRFEKMKSKMKFITSDSQASIIFIGIAWRILNNILSLSFLGLIFSNNFTLSPDGIKAISLILTNPIILSIYIVFTLMYLVGSIFNVEYILLSWMYPETDSMDSIGLKKLYIDETLKFLNKRAEINKTIAQTAVMFIIVFYLVMPIIGYFSPNYDPIPFIAFDFRITIFIIIIILIIYDITATMVIKIMYESFVQI